MLPKFVMNRLAAVSLTFAVSACVTSSVEKAYEKAEVYGPQDPAIGVVLYLHGCGGLGVAGEIWSWADFFIKQGWEFVAPNSFADPRPQVVCPETNVASRRDIKNSIRSLRVAQAEYALERTRADYPGLPIIVWGHSEGSGVAIQVKGPVDAVITTGHRCSMWWRDRLRLATDTPYLAIVSSEDRYFSKELRARGPEYLRRQCDRNITGKAWTYYVAEGERHRPRIANKSIRMRVMDFLEHVATAG